MTRITKLYQQLLNPGPGSIAFREFERLLRAFGFVHERTVGSDRQYVHPRVPRPFPVQPAGKDAKRYQIREFIDMIETYGLSIEQE